MQFFFRHSSTNLHDRYKIRNFRRCQMRREHGSLQTSWSQRYRWHGGLDIIVTTSSLLYIINKSPPSSPCRVKVVMLLHPSQCFWLFGSFQDLSLLWYAQSQWMPNPLRLIMQGPWHSKESLLVLLLYVRVFQDGKSLYVMTTFSGTRSFCSVLQTESYLLIHCDFSRSIGPMWRFPNSPVTRAPLHNCSIFARMAARACFSKRKESFRLLDFP